MMMTKEYFWVLNELKSQRKHEMLLVNRGRRMNWGEQDEVVKTQADHLKKKKKDLFDWN